MTVQTLSLYLYGVIPYRPDRLDPDLRGLVDRPIQLLAYRDLAVIASDTEQTRFRLQRDLLLAHTGVLERAIACGLTVLPIRFGTPVSCAERVIERWLHPHYEELAQLMAQMTDHYEMGLRVMGDRQKLIEEAVEASPEIQKFRETIATQPPAATYHERIQIGTRIAQALAHRRQVYQESILDPLRPLAADFRLNDTLGDAMLLNAAFLIRADRETAFDQAVEALQERHPDLGLQFRYVRHAPPYNFVNLEVNFDDNP